MAKVATTTPAPTPQIAFGAARSNGSRFVTSPVTRPSRPPAADTSARAMPICPMTAFTPVPPPDRPRARPAEASRARARPHPARVGRDVRLRVLHHDLVRGETVARPDEVPDDHDREAGAEHLRRRARVEDVDRGT